MSNSFDKSLLEALSNLVRVRTGLKFDAARLTDLERGVRSASRELGFANAQECAAWLVSSSLTEQHIRILAGHLTIGETYFFREKGSFQLIEERILPELIEARGGVDQHLRIWSAGCCTGEEAYSLAIALSRVLPDPKSWQATILATDINEHFLNKAREAIFGNWSFREAETDALEGYFTHEVPGRHRLLPRLRNYVTVAPLNLTEDVYPSAANGTHAMDLILCRNVMIYLDEQQAQRVVQRLGRCLVEGGWLLVGAAEGPLIQLAELKSAEVPGVMAFRKMADGAAPSVSPAQVPAPAPAFQFPVATSLDFHSHVARMAPAKPLPQLAEADTEHLVISTATEAYVARRYAAVIDSLVPWCRSNPSSATAMELLSRAYANQGDQTAALIWCERAVNSRKSDARLHYLHASILQELGRIVEAAASLRRAIYLDPDFVMAHVGASHLAQKRGMRAESQRHIEIARRLLASHDASQPVPEAEGLDAAQLARMIEADVMIQEPS